MPKAQTATKPKPAASRAGARPGASRAGVAEGRPPQAGRAEISCQGSRPQGAGCS